MYIYICISIYLHSVKGFQNSRNICGKLICVFLFTVNYNTSCFWLVMLIYIYICIYICMVCIYKFWSKNDFLITLMESTQHLFQYF